MPKNEKLILLKQALILLITNAFIHVAYSGYGPFLSIYYERQGISVAQIGILLSIGPIASIIIQPFWARVSDKTGRRKLFLMIVVGGASLAILTYYLGNSFSSFFLATVAMATFSTSIGPLCDTLIVEESRKLGINFAHIRLGGTIGYSIAVTVAGAILKVSPNALFLMSSILYGCMLLAASQLPADKPVAKTSAIQQTDKRSKSDDDLEQSDQKGFLNIFKSKEIIIILLFAMTFQMGISFYSSYLGVYLGRLGRSSFIGIASSIGALGEIPMLLIIDKARRKLGTIPILIFCSSLLIMRLLLITQGSLPALLICQAVQGVSFIPVYLCCVMFISENVLPGRQSQGQSCLAIVQGGVASIVGNVGGGQLVRILDFPGVYYAMAGIIFTLTVVNVTMYLVFFRKNSKRSRATANIAP